MTNTKVKTFIDKASTRVVDEDFIRWDKSFWVGALNDAIKAVIGVRPDASVENRDIPCQEGTIQKVPDDCNLLMNVVRNSGGKAIRGLDDMELLNNYRPDWIESQGFNEAECWMQDDSNPEVFYLYPGVTNNHQVYATVSVNPLPLTDADYQGNSPITLSPIYDNAISEYMIYLAFVRDAEFAANEQKANAALMAFFKLLGVKNTSDSQFYKAYQQSQQQPK